MTCYDVFLRRYCLEMYKDMISQLYKMDILYSSLILYSYIHSAFNQFFHPFCIKRFCDAHMVWVLALGKGSPCRLDACWISSIRREEPFQNLFWKQFPWSCPSSHHLCLDAWKKERGGKEIWRKPISLSHIVYRIITCSCHAAFLIHSYFINSVPVLEIVSEFRLFQMDRKTWTDMGRKWCNSMWRKSEHILHIKGHC